MGGKEIDFGIALPTVFKLVSTGYKVFWRQNSAFVNSFCKNYMNVEGDVRLEY